MKKLVVTLLPILLFLACQKAPLAIEYVKYENDAAIPRISAEDAKKEYEAGNAIFVDTRGEGAWKVERLPGALEISNATPEDKYDALPKGKKIITYCS
jgi:hypothetical protein